MDTFTLHYPGSWPLDSSGNPYKATGVVALLGICETHLADAAMGLAMYEHAKSAVSPGQAVPPSYFRRLIFVHARTVVYALDDVVKMLRVLERETALAAVGAAAATLESQLPGLRSVRNSSHHLEDRGRGLGIKGKLLKLQAIKSGIVAGAPAGTVLALSNFNGDNFGFTGSDGGHHEVPITAQSVRFAQEAIQSVLKALAWRGAPYDVP